MVSAVDVSASMLVGHEPQNRITGSCGQTEMPCEDMVHPIPRYEYLQPSKPCHVICPWFDPRGLRDARRVLKFICATPAATKSHGRRSVASHTHTVESSTPSQGQPRVQRALGAPRERDSASVRLFIGRTGAALGDQALTMQQATRVQPRPLVSPLPSPTTSHAESSFSVSRYAAQGLGLSHSTSSTSVAPPLQKFSIGNTTKHPNPYDTRSGHVDGMQGRQNSASQSIESRQMSERVVQTHWETFRIFLNSGQQNHPRQNKAREKLTRLSGTQFQELSTDVYDEVQRRTRSSNSAPMSLPPNPTFHPKRNQAREKLASLQTPRFKDLASDVYFEIERRFPNVGSASLATSDISSRSTSPLHSPVAEHQRQDSSSSSVHETRSIAKRPQPNVFRQTAVIPVKSTMIEEDSDSEDETVVKSLSTDPGYASLNSSDANSNFEQRPVDASRDVLHRAESQDVESLLTKIRDLEQELRSQTDVSFATRKLKLEMEEILETNDNLEEELAKMRLSSQRQPVMAEDTGLKEENARLVRELELQRRLTEEVRSEAEGFLNEMRGLSERESAIFDQAEGLQAKVSELENEVEVWKERFFKSKTQLRQLKATSQFFSPMPELREGSRDAFVSPDGVIKDIAVTKFQESIDSLLRIARTNATELPEAMKEVILAVRLIHQDLEDSSSTSLKDGRVIKLRQRMSNTIQNLMIACKNHASGGSLSPVSLVDAAASHLSCTVIEIARICKLKAVSIGDEDVDEMDSSRHEPSRGTRAHQVAESARPQGATSTHSQVSPGTQNDGFVNEKRQGSSFDHENQSPPQIPAQQFERKRSVNGELRTFLESQTEGIVAAIQRLLSAVRSDAKTPILQTYMGDIVTIVTLVTSSMREAFESSRPLQTSAGDIVRALESCTSRIRDMENAVSRSGEQQASKEFKQRLAGIAFDTAKQTKELSIVLQSDESVEVDLT